MILKVLATIISYIVIPIIQKLIEREIIKASEKGDLEKLIKLGEKKLELLKLAKEALDEAGYNSNIDDI